MALLPAQGQSSVRGLMRWSGRNSVMEVTGSTLAPDYQLRGAYHSIYLRKTLKLKGSRHLTQDTQGIKSKLRVEGRPVCLGISNLLCDLSSLLLFSRAGWKDQGKLFVVIYSSSF